MKLKLNIAMLLSILTLTSCQQFQQAFTDTNPSSTAFTNEANPEVPYSFSNFSDIPIPEESSMVIEKTRVFGEEDHWVGTLSLNSPFKIGNIYDFYSSQMPKFEWKKLSVIRGEQTILTYLKDGRIATIFVESRALSGTNISFTVSPIPNEIKEMLNVKEDKPEQKPVSSPEIKEDLTFPSMKNTYINESGALNLGDSSINTPEADSNNFLAPEDKVLDKEIADFYNF